MFLLPTLSNVPVRVWKKPFGRQSLDSQIVLSVNVFALPRGGSSETAQRKSNIYPVRKDPWLGSHLSDLQTGNGLDRLTQRSIPPSWFSILSDTHRSPPHNPPAPTPSSNRPNGKFFSKFEHWQGSPRSLGSLAYGMLTVALFNQIFLFVLLEGVNRPTPRKRVWDVSYDNRIGLYIPRHKARGSFLLWVYFS